MHEAEGQPARARQQGADTPAPPQPGTAGPAGPQMAAGGAAPAARGADAGRSRPQQGGFFPDWASI